MRYSLNIGIGGSKMIGAIMLLSKLDRSGVGGGVGMILQGVTEAHTVKMW